MDRPRHPGGVHGRRGPAGPRPQALTRRDSRTGGARGRPRRLPVFHATGRFHVPCYAREWTAPGIQEEFTAVVDLLVRGLRP
ncbi:hypothetical protein GCM10010503_13110 [Streptomyces lucensis JCM 4490]|uniref:Tetracyclin repressor-like C-terminal domain-containing protein n=1 Tax=Streptomyces lucensis JCM 4490 TaxID=1306176 RepID=A0A918IYK9_9ACTN|nr:hypothetical protein GCM10010503_13110 [Streptomyces lucensis JCM 4490]